MPDRHHQRSGQWRWGILAVMAGGFLTALDTSAVALALPTLMRAFHAELPLTQWVVLASLLMTTTLVIPAGRLADLWGHRRVYSIGLALFILGAALSAPSRALTALILMRLLQGTGAAAITAAGQAILTTVIPEGKRSRALGLLHAAIALGLLTGPPAAGWLIGVLGWQGIFLLQVPLGTLGLWAAQVGLEETSVSGGGRFDLLGAILLGSTIASMFLALTLSQSELIPSGALAVLIIFTIGMGTLFIKREHRAQYPLLPTALFQRRAFTMGVLCALLTFVAMAANMFVMPLLLQTLIAYSPKRAGAILTVVPLVIIFLAPWGGALADRFGPRGPASAGLACVVGGIFLMSRLESTASPLQIVAALGLYGLGAALFQSPNNSAVLGAVAKEKRGTASGVLATARSLGQMVGLAAASAILTARGAAALAPGGSLAAPFQETFLILAAVAGVGLTISWTRGSSDSTIAELPVRDGANPRR